MNSLLPEEIEFLKESNAIEGVYDDDSLLQAALAWEYLKGQKKLTLSVLLKTHKILMLNQPLFGYQRGYFREVPVWIGGREGADWTQIRTKLKEWLKGMNKVNSKNPEYWLQRGFDSQTLHVEYEKVHPFVDGNGRTGRMFMNWHRLKIGLPILVIHTGQEQRDYYSWFK